MIDWPSLAAILSAFFVVAVSPGPATIAVSSVAAGFGRRSGLAFGAGLGVGLSLWGVVAATGLGAVLQTTSHVLFALKIIGGLYLLWLALQSARSAVRPSAAKGAIGGGGRWFVRGLALNATNPKAVVAWMAALSVGLGADDGAAVLGAATCSCVLFGFAIYAGYALAFSMPAIRRHYLRVGRGIDGAVSALFALSGCALLRSAFARAPSPT